MARPCVFEVVWQFESDWPGYWKDFSIGDAVVCETKLQHSITKFYYTRYHPGSLIGFRWFIDIDEGSQLNLDSGRKRQVRRMLQPNFTGM